MKAPTPPNESRRIAALREYQLLDTPPEQSFDDITALAAAICRVPIAMMVLLDSERQWFKSRIGLNASETPRDHAFCAHAIMDTAPFIVEDAINDPRFASNPLVTADPNIRFYAGAPLIDSEGNALGTLCVIDREPRRLDAAQQKALQILARQTMSQMELRRQARSLAEALENVRALQGLLPMCSWCKNIRDDSGYWTRVEDYLQVHTGATTTHGMCPTCFDKVQAEEG